MTQLRPDLSCPDAVLLQRAAAGERAAFDVLCRRHVPRLVAAASQVCHGRADAEDVVQEALVRAWRNAHRFDPARGAAAAWLHRIVLNAAIDAVRRAPAARPLADAALADLPDGGADALGGLTRRHDRRTLAAGIASLPSRQLAALRLTYADGLTGQDAARRLGVSARAVEGLLRRARRSLRDWLVARGVSE